MDPPRPPLGDFVRRLRARAGLTQEELAQAAGLSVRSISDLERGLRRRVYPDTGVRLADALGLEGKERAGFLHVARGRPAPSHRSAPGRGTGPGALPVPPSPLIGREREVKRALRMLQEEGIRLLTLTGAGGIGKTRLALEVAERMCAHRRVWFVPLADTAGAELVPSAIAAAVGVVAGVRSPEEALTVDLREETGLIVLDTFEHVLPAALLVAKVLASSPELSILVTSRAPLGIRGEHELPVPPLASAAEASPANEGPGPPAVALFLQRARAVRPDPATDPEDAAVAADICRRLEGLPLAIELAAIRLRHLTLDALRDQLIDRLGVLTGGPRDLPPRQRAMRETIAWSYRLLEDGPRRLLDWLSVFAGGWTLDAAGEVCGLTPGEALDGLGALIDQGLVLVAGGDEGPRYRMLDVIREFAAERLGLSGEEQVARRLHAAYFAELAEEAEPRLGGEGQVRWLRRLEAERENVRSALAWSIDGREADLALRLSGAHWRVWQVRGQLAEGRAWLGGALSVGGGTSPRNRARALWGAGWLAFHQGDYEEAGRLAKELLALERTLDDPIGTRNALTVRGMVAMGRGRYAAALPALRECVRICRGLGPGWHLATSLLNLAQPTMHLGDLAEAEALLTEARRLYRDLGDRLFEARAVEYLGFVALLGGDTGRAGRLLAASLKGFRHIGDPGGVAEALAGLAAVEAAVGNALAAARIAAASDELRASEGARPLPFERAITEPLVEKARRAETADAWAAAWEEGAELGPDGVVGLAGAVSGAGPTPRRGARPS